MTTTISPPVSLGVVTSMEPPPVDRNEFNEEIYGYLAQLHQEQMRQLELNHTRPKLPSHVQQTLNLNTAFLSFSEKMVAGCIAQQIRECINCHDMHGDWFLKEPSSEFHTQVSHATEFLDRMVDAHNTHGEIDQEQFFEGDGQSEYRQAKLTIAVIQAQLQASAKFQKRMEDIVKELWEPRLPFSSNNFARIEMLLLEWKLVSSNSKALYHHYLYYFGRVTVAEDTLDAVDKELVVTEEKESFIQTASLLSDKLDQLVAGHKDKKPLQNSLAGPTTSSEVMGERSRRESSPQTWSQATDQSWENIEFSGPQTLKGFMNGDEIQNDTVKVTEELVNRFLESLSIKEGQRSSCPSLSETESLPSSNSSMADDVNEQDSAPHQEAFTKISLSWVSLATKRASFNSKGSGEIEGSNQDPSEDAPETSRGNKNASGKEQDFQGRQLSNSPFSHRKIGRDSDGQDNDDENEDDGRERKRQRSEAMVDLRTFACPYFKRNPEKHVQKSCTTTTYSTMHRLKEHLYRVHRIYPCLRCHQEFWKDEDLLNHHQEANPCQRRLNVPPTYLGFDESQQQSLRRRRRTNKEVETNEDNMRKWEEMYRVLFPKDDSIPTYYHNVQDQFRQQVDEQLLQYNEYQQRELPVLIGRKLGTSGDIGEVANMDLTSIVNECLSEILKNYKLSSNQDGQHDIREADSVCEAALASVRGEGEDSCVSDIPLECTISDSTPRFDGINQDPLSGTKTWDDFSLDNEFNFGFGNSGGDASSSWDASYAI